MLGGKNHGSTDWLIGGFKNINRWEGDDGDVRCGDIKRSASTRRGATAETTETAVVTKHRRRSRLPKRFSGWPGDEAALCRDGLRDAVSSLRRSCKAEQFFGRERSRLARQIRSFLLVFDGLCQGFLSTAGTSVMRLAFGIASGGRQIPRSGQVDYMLELGLQPGDRCSASYRLEARATAGLVPNVSRKGRTKGQASRPQN